MLKDRLDSLLRASLALAAPSSKVVTQNVTANTQEFVAPFDGYAVVVAGNVNRIDAVNIENHGVQSFVPSYLSAWSCAWVPCRKGQTIRLTLNGTAYPIVRFIASQSVT